MSLWVILTTPICVPKSRVIIYLAILAIHMEMMARGKPCQSKLNYFDMVCHVNCHIRFGAQIGVKVDVVNIIVIVYIYIRIWFVDFEMIILKWWF